MLEDEESDVMEKCSAGFVGSSFNVTSRQANGAKVELVEAGSVCNEKCGNFSIEYPFGIREGCCRDGFQISCKNDTNGIYKPYYTNVEIINISIFPPRMRIYNWITRACYNSSGLPIIDEPYHLNFTNIIYWFSDTHNKFTAIGCRTLAYIQDNSDQFDPYMSGCLSICSSNNSVIDKALCSGMGCCQTSILKGMKYYDVTFDEGFNHSYVVDFSPCSYAFLGDQEYIFNSSDVNMFEFNNRNESGVPIMLDWAIGNQDCVKSSNMMDYACLSKYSYCVDSVNGPGYTCNCSIGFQGNPYILGGCIDIDECINKTQYNCYGECYNVAGSFTCTCPSGYEGDPFQKGGCRPKQKLLLSLLLIGALCIFIVTAVVYLVHEKAKLSRAKRNCFRQNGGLLLQEQISAHQCVRFKMFPAEEINKATNSFHESQIVGRGGQGIVYKGNLDDKRRVAI